MDFKELKQRYAFVLSAFIAALALVAFFDKTLAVAILFFIFLFTVAFLIFDAMGVKSRLVFLIFIFAFAAHLLAVLFISYADFQPFGGGGGNYLGYHIQGQEVYNRLHSGNFSVKGIATTNYYPVVVGYIYALTSPSMLMGQIFNAWLSAFTVVIAYLIMLQIGISRLAALLTAMIINIYPSFVFFGSLLLAEALITFLAIFGLFLAIKLIDRFSWRNFMIFYLMAGFLTYVRFIIGFSLLLTFIICWIFFSNMDIKKRMIYAIVIIILLGFLPQLASQGYYGFNLIEKYISPPHAELMPVAVATSFAIAFFNNLLGPFAWQLTRSRQAFALLETLPWFFLFLLSVTGAAVSFKKTYQSIAPLILFSLIVLGMASFLLTNFGIITRFRIPAIISLVCLVPLSLGGLKYIKIPWRNT
ncbi:MAG: phospholipid carrier-dependent glycosyltransferase [bacterium]|nr:phospholipid carrier-dependent glycosyltransferase [bacterium]